MEYAQDKSFYTAIILSATVVLDRWLRSYRQPLCFLYWDT